MTEETKPKPMDIWDYAKLPMDVSARLSFERTMLSHERTLMAWIRTATSLITFGFTLYKFFELEAAGQIKSRPHQIFGPREFAILMIGIGLMGLAFAAMDNRRHRNNMRRSGLKAPMSYTTVVAVLIAVLGFVALFSVIFRW
jgi:putative membrane protein